MSKATKNNILNSFSDLLLKYDLDKITVTMLVSECNISRQTFYYHFSDIEDLVNWGVKSATAGCLEVAKNAENWREATRIYFGEIEENKPFLSNCLNSSLSNYTFKLIKESIIDYTLAFYKTNYTPDSFDANDFRFFVVYNANAVTGLIAEYINDESEYSIDDIINKVCRIISILDL